MACEMVLLWWKALEGTVQIRSLSRVSCSLTAGGFYMFLEQAPWAW